MFTSRRTLGLAFSPSAITAAEILSVRGRHRLMHAGEIPLTAEAALKDPAKLGKAIKEFLRRNHMSATRCVIGLNAASTVAKEKRLPPQAATAMQDILRLATEQDFASEGQELMFDYVPAAGGKPTNALLAAAPRAVADALKSAAEAAGLAVVAVTSSALTLARATAPALPAGDRFLLALTANGAELVVQSSGRPRLLRGLCPAAGLSGESATRQLAGLEAELRRVLMSAASDDSAGAAELAVWGASDGEATALEEMGKNLGLSTRLCAGVESLDGMEGPLAPASTDVAAAVALAEAANQPATLELDFLHSRLEIRTKRRWGRVALWGGLAAAALTTLAVYMVMDARANQRDIADLQARLDKIAPDLRAAKEVVTKATFVRGWYDRRPKFLDCLREVTMAFPEEGKIWATSLVITEDMHVVLSGMSSGEEAVLTLRDHMKLNPRLTEIKALYIREAGANTREVTFAISFAFVTPGAS